MRCWEGIVGHFLGCPPSSPSPRHFAESASFPQNVFRERAWARYVNIHSFILYRLCLLRLLHELFIGVLLLHRGSQRQLTTFALPKQITSQNEATEQIRVITQNGMVIAKEGNAGNSKNARIESVWGRTETDVRRELEPVYWVSSDLSSRLVRDLATDLAKVGMAELEERERETGWVSWSEGRLVRKAGSGRSGRAGG